MKTWAASVTGGHYVLRARGAAVIGAGGVTGFRAKIAVGGGDVLSARGATMAELAMFFKTGCPAAIGVRCVATT